MPPIYVLDLPTSSGMTRQTMKGCVPLPFMIDLESTDGRCSPGFPLGLFSDYSTHGAEISIKIRETEQNKLEVFTSEGELYMTVIGRRDSKLLFDSQGVAVLNVRNKTLNFGGEYQVSQRNRILRQSHVSDYQK